MLIFNHEMYFFDDLITISKMNPNAAKICMIYSRIDGRYATQITINKKDRKLMFTESKIKIFLLYCTGNE